MRITKLRFSAALLCVIGTSGAFATDGYFAAGYGVKSLGMGGVGIALPLDGLVSAYNPAGIGMLDSQVNLGLTLFRADRNADIVGNAVPGANGHYDGNYTKNFYIPEMAYVNRYSKEMSFGLAIYGNGGMDTGYTKNPFAAFGSTGSAAINLTQLYVKPSVSYKLNEQHTFGAAVNFLYTRFNAEGLQAFSSLSAYPNNLTNQGHDKATGWGIHLGWIGQLTKEFSVGATWSSKVKTGRFDNYRGLFVDAGKFDVPEFYGIGAAFKASPVLTLAADVQRIKYSEVGSLGNPLSNLFAGNPLGSPNGPGFGWKDITVVKLGASYDVNPGMTLRIGYNRSGSPIPADQTLFNILAPAIVQDHLSLGGSWKTSPNGEWSMYYMHVFKKDFNGVNSIPAAFGGGNANLHLVQDSLGVAYSWKL